MSGRGGEDYEALDRPTLYDTIREDTATENLFCQRADLSNEASVETFFADRVIAELGYEDSETKTKSSIEALEIPRGRKTERYKPDYVLHCDGKPRVVIDAKSPSENLDDWVLQCQGYSTALNRRYSGENPVQYYVLTNGDRTQVFRWDEDKPIQRLTFSDFQEGAVGWQEFEELLRVEKARKGWEDDPAPKSSRDTMRFRKPPIEDLKGTFLNCHRTIWKSEKINPSAAFFEFVKLMFVKMYEDRRIHTDEDLSAQVQKFGRVPKSEIRFSVDWVEGLEDTHDNPIDALLFESLLEKLNEEVRKGNKKRIFPPGESIRLSPGTMKEVVQRLENKDLWGIDEDLNGRLFETFLSATMRGQDLGQYFTPRSIVKFMTRLAAPRAEPGHVERCLDACCGTGGFLIEILTKMRDQVRENRSLSRSDRRELLHEIADESIYGMDAGKEPSMAQISRINMYLHGDGGSRIYALDALDKTISPSSAAEPEERPNCEELRRLLSNGLEFDLILTNPPFSMNYSEEHSDERRILEQYDLRTKDYSGSRDGRKRLRSSIMFLERYHDLLKPGGRLVTVMDDSILSSSKWSFARDWIREKFLIRAVISLPGDAFQRVGARQKTSVLYLEKKKDPDEEQPAVFMVECAALGLEDKPQRTPDTERRKAKERTREEVEEVLSEFKAFQEGEEGPWLVDPEDVQDRLDVKYCRPHPNPAKDLWEEKGVEWAPLSDLVERVTDELSPADHPNEVLTFLEISYEGEPGPGDQKLGVDIGYDTVYTAQPGDIVVSHINAVHGAVCVLPPELGDAVISKEYTILRVKEDAGVSPLYLWMILRSPEFKALLLSEASGGGRHRIDWGTLKDLEVPVLPDDEQEQITGKLRRASEARQTASELETDAVETLEETLGLRNEEALRRLRASGPPS